MNKSDQFILMSKYAGMREDLIQAGGGNSSVKLDENKMLIKASGYQMADITSESGFSMVNHKIVTDIFSSTDFDALELKDEADIIEKSRIEGPKPSIETFLHSITDVYTLHTHPVVVNILAVRDFSELKNLFPNALYVDYATPGIMLAKEYFKSYMKSKTNANQVFDIIFLKNHGLIVSGKTAQEVIEKTEEVLTTIENYLPLNMQKFKISTKIYMALRDTSSNDDIVYLSNHCDIKNMIDNYGIWDHCFCPDCVVFLGKKSLVFENDVSSEIIKNHIGEYGNVVVILVKNNMYIIASSVKKAKEIESILAFSANIMLGNLNKKIDLLSDMEQNKLLNLDSEKYRQGLK